MGRAVSSPWCDALETVPADEKRRLLDAYALAPLWLSASWCDSDPEPGSKNQSGAGAPHSKAALPSPTGVGEGGVGVGEGQKPQHPTSFERYQFIRCLKTPTSRAQHAAPVPTNGHGIARTICKAATAPLLSVKICVNLCPIHPGLNSHRRFTFSILGPGFRPAGHGRQACPARFQATCARPKCAGIRRRQHPGRRSTPGTCGSSRAKDR